MNAYRWMTAASLVLCVNAGGGCTKPPVEGDATAPPHATTARQQVQTAPPRRQTLTAAARMREHFREADVMRRGLIAGDLQLVQRTSNEMAADEWSSRLKPTWQPYVATMRAAASSIAQSQDLVAASEGFATLAGTCAQCHLSLDASKAPPVSPAPQEPTNSMRAHAEASELMWWGLSAPSDETWRTGAQQLARVQLASDVTSVAALQARLVGLAESASAAPTSERPHLYAKTLQTCAGCHRHVGLTLSVEGPSP